MSCIRTTIKFSYKKLQKNLFQNSFIQKKIGGKMDMQSFFKVIMLAHYMLFAPKNSKNFGYTQDK